MAYATNAADYITQVAPGVYPATNGVYAEGNLGYVDDSGYPAHDLEKAKALVAEYTADTGQPLEFTYTGVSNVDDSRRQQILKSMWESRRHEGQPAGRPPGRPGDHDRARQVPGDRLPTLQPARPRQGLGLAQLARAIGKNGDLSLNIARYATPRSTPASTTGARPPTTRAARPTTRR